MFAVEKVLRNEVHQLGQRMYDMRVPMPAFTARYERYNSPEEYIPTSDWFEFRVGDHWDCTFRQTMRLRTKMQAPECPAGKYLALNIDIGGEATVCVNGVMLETISSNLEHNHYVIRSQVRLPAEFSGKELNIEIEACMNFLSCLYSTSPAIRYEDAIISTKCHDASLVMIDEQLEALYNDARAVLEALPQIDDGHLRKKLIEAATKACMDQNDPAAARAELKATLETMPAGLGEILFIGQAHIDTAWLWTIRESIRKTRRTFLNVLNLMEQYPEFNFAFSQPALFNYCEKHYPDLFEKIKEKVAEGRIELVGNAWVEMDANIPSGESLVRQLLYGRRYYRTRFGKDSKVFWMPDVFGYSWALPQIMRRSGVDYFFTSKLINNDTNRFPHSLFTWKGVDGTPILAYLQRMNYNGMLNAATLRKLDSEFEQKDTVPEALMTFGFGDGGGGPTAWMLENYQRYKNFPGLPKARMATAKEFFDDVAPYQSELPEWNDEMYYECHRGTYTSQAFVKKNNRMLEQLLRKAEIICATANVYLGVPYPHDELRDIWQEMLTLQFHDILPGSSVNAVYRECRETYAQLKARAEAVIAPAMAKLAEAAPAGADTWNFRPWDEDGVPAMFCGTPALPVSGVSASADCLENEFLKVEFDKNGLITSIYDKENDREVLAEGAKGNLITMFVDRPAYESAWNIDPTYQNEYTELIDAESIEVVGNDTIHIVRRVGNSVIEQDIVLKASSRRLDFVTRADWHEKERMLKAAFPVDIHAQMADCEIQFGTIQRPTHRNTSYDAAKFEICSHRWTDLSEGGYGVSILNDCKYGYDVLGNCMRITMLRCPNYPDPYADEGEHEFTYSLYPHTGDWRNGVVKEAYRLNVPMEEYASGGAGVITAPVAKVLCDHAALDTVKCAEDGRGVIIRMYETNGARGPVKVQLGKVPAKVTECNLMEDDEQNVEFDGNTFSLRIKPYQIRTFRVEF